MSSDESEHQEEPEKEEFGELLKFTAGGGLGGLLLGLLMDYLGFQRSPLGQWIVRGLSGEGGSLFEGIFAWRQRIRRAGKTMAEAYGWGKLLGMFAPWVIDWGSRHLG